MFKNLFNKVKNGVNYLISEPETNFQKQPDNKSQSKHYTSYSLSEIFPFKTHIITE